MLTRTRRFYRRVERQNIGLEGDTVNHGGNFGNLLRTGGDIAHGFHHPGDHLATPAGFTGSIFRQLAGMVRVIGVLFHGCGELLHAGRRLLNGRGLLLGTGREIGVACGDFAGATIDLFRPLTHGTDGILQRVLHGLQVARQAANFAASGHIVRHGQVAFGDIFNAFRGALQRGDHRATQHDKGHGRQHQRQGKRAHHKHQAQLCAAVCLNRQGVRALGADLYRLQQHGVVGVIQRAGAFVFMVNDGFKHAVFSKLKHRLQACDIGVIACFQIGIQRFILRRTNRAIDVGVKPFLRLLDPFFRLRDVLLHCIHFRDTARRPGVDHIDTRGAQMIRAV